MIPLSQYLRRGKAARDIKINVKPEADTVIPVAKKQSWKQACLEYQIKNGFVPPEPAPEPAAQAKDVCTIDDIKRVVTAYFNLFGQDLESHRRDHRVMLPRQIAYFLAVKLTTKSLPAIGRSLGFRDHTTVMSGAKKIRRLMQMNETLKPIIDEIENHITKGIPVNAVPRPARFTKPSHWSVEDERLAAELSRRGLSYPEIGNVLGRSQHAVRKRMQRLGLTGHAYRVATRREEIKREYKEIIQVINGETSVEQT